MGVPGGDHSPAERGAGGESEGVYPPELKG